jgi:hypothetical protein
MKPETALRLAASAADTECRVSVDQATAIVKEFLARMALCPACDGSGDLEVGRETERTATLRNGDQGSHTVRLESGSLGPCPRCGGAHGDPDWVYWVCLVASRYGYGLSCDPRGVPRGQEDRHSQCGWRLALPLDLMGNGA